MSNYRFVEVNTDRAAGDVIDGEAIIINLVTGAYYSMQGIGGRIWSMIAARRSTASILEEIVATYDVDADTAASDLDAVLAQMFEEELIRIADEGHDPAIEPVATRQPYARPRLQVFRDMQELLALDPPAPGMNQIAWTDGTKK